MGTVVSFSLREATTDAEAAGDTPAAFRRSERQGASRADLELALRRAEERLLRADDVFSTYKPESPVSRLRRGEIAVGGAPPEVAEVLELCARARDVSEGWFDPWSMPGGVDPTGLVKGWAAERAMDEFRAVGAQGALINAGGDVVAIGSPAPGEPWRIGVRHPLAADRLLLTLQLDGAGAVATSGSYERGLHLVDPHTGEFSDGLLAATVTGLDLTYADALATALYVSGGTLLDRIGRLAGYHGFVVYADGTLRASHGLQAGLTFAA
jgi:thiamine biosynthesis lipoprotein